MEMNKALIAMSGGVDSSVAAALMVEAGYACIGATMKLFQNEDVGVSREHSCCSLEDVEDARSVAYRLGMPYYVFNFADRFQEQVIEPFVSAYEQGRTPNPCIDCNRYLKFEKLFFRARELFCDVVVTGHYARIDRDESTGRFLLKKALDETKDQSYVLYSLTQEQLSHVQFPLGEMPKTRVRELAARYGFINANKQDSQDICFVQNGRYADFIEEYRGKSCTPGEFRSLDGRCLGQHRGIIRYTLGQRKGLGLSFACPMYVVSLDPQENTVTLGPNDALFSTRLLANQLNLISVPRIEGSLRVKAKVRYRHREDWAIVRQLDEDVLEVVFETPQRAITPGQAVVLYDDDVVVGGGTIFAVSDSADQT